MFSRLLLGGTFVVFILIIGTAYVMMPQNGDIVITSQASTVTTSISTPPMPTTSSYTMAKVAQHNTTSSCWSAINGNVYNLTSWINQHPGGPQVILALCGTDGSAAFNGQHGGQARPASELKSFLLGPLSS